jgi:cell division septal protein FtsQ
MRRPEKKKYRSFSGRRQTYKRKVGIASGSFASFKSRGKYAAANRIEFIFNRVIIFAVALFLISYCFYLGFIKASSWFYNLKIWTIKKIEIVGVSEENKKYFPQILKIAKGDNLLDFNLSEIEKELENSTTQFKNIKISRRINKIVVRAEEKIPQALVSKNKQLYAVDFDNKIFPAGEELKKLNVPEIEFKNEIEAKIILNFIKNAKSLSQEFFSKILNVKLGDSEDIIIKLRSGEVVFWGQIYEETDKESKLKIGFFVKVYSLATTTENGIPLEYIDLSLFRNTGKAAVKYKKNSDKSAVSIKTKNNPAAKK